jgi:hypothetical protein
MLRREKPKQFLKKNALAFQEGLGGKKKQKPP